MTTHPISRCCGARIRIDGRCADCDRLDRLNQAPTLQERADELVSHAMRLPKGIRPFALEMAEVVRDVVAQAKEPNKHP